MSSERIAPTGRPRLRARDAVQQRQDAADLVALRRVLLGYNPVEHLLGPQALAALPAHEQATLMVDEGADERDSALTVAAARRPG